MLSAVARCLDSLPDRRLDRLIDHVLTGGGRSGAEPAFQVVTAAYTGFRDAVGAAGRGWSGSKLQYLLSTQAISLAFTAYERLPARTRWWFLRLSTRAGLRAVEAIDSSSYRPTRGRRLNDPFTDVPDTDPPTGPRDVDVTLDAPDLIDEYKRRIEPVDDADPEGAKLLEKLVARARQLLGPDHRVTLVFQHNLARRYDKTGSARAAVGLYAATYPTAREVLGDSHPVTASCEQALGSRDLRRRAEEEGRGS
jgi:hypothetical protein